MAESISLADYRALVAKGVSAKPKRRASPEEDLHRACMEWVAFSRAAHPRLKWMIHVPNGGKRPRGEAGKMKALGVKKGVLDILLPRPSPSLRWNGLAIELKAPNSGRLSQDQAEWLEAHAEDGWLVGVVRTLDEFIALTESYLLDIERPTKNRGHIF